MNPDFFRLIMEPVSQNDFAQKIATIAWPAGFGVQQEELLFSQVLISLLGFSKKLFKRKKARKKVVTEALPQQTRYFGFRASLTQWP